jgi:hypothetical protein
MREREQPRGLRSIADARDARKASRINKFNRPTAATWGLLAGGVVGAFLLYWYFAGRQVTTAKDALLAQQRAASVTVGAEWAPLRDKIEELTLDAAGPYAGDLVAPGVDKWDFRAMPGLYLRLRAVHAKDAASMRKAASDSVKDAFVACLFRYQHPASKGEVDAGAFPDQPWNLRQAYQATRVLDDAWVAQVKAADDTMRLRVFEQQYEKAKRDEIPLAVDVVKRAQFYLFILDEDVPEAAALADGGPVTEEHLQLVAHPARVNVVNLKTGDVVARVRRTGDASFVFAGERAVTDPDVRQAMQRQVNNCSLAQQFWGAVRPSASPDGDAGAQPPK